MKQFRIKKEAVPFFNQNVATAINDLDTWKKYQVDEKALEEVEPLYITYGHAGERSSDYGTKYSSLSGWSDGSTNNQKGSHFHFTLNFPSVKFREHDEFLKGKTVRNLMEKIQSQLNYFYQDFINEEESEN